MKKIRNKGRITTIIDEEYRSCTFHETDNLHVKKLQETENVYEKVFVMIRSALEQNEQYCCDDEDDRLSVAQIITDELHRSGLIRPKGTGK
tara:strand:+ start:201 stop:473 length:273 start_codon:yes stop_codon:yes gene_type:complete